MKTRGCGLLCAIGLLLWVSGASSTPLPTTVTLAGSLQSELGCPGDWQPDCVATHLLYDANDAIWQNTFALPAGNYEYKAAIDDSWDENYGANAVVNGANIPLSLAASSSVKFYYDPLSHWITDSKSSVIVTAPGSFQSELGCAGDWDPGCLRSWLEDPDGDGIYTMITNALPVGNYETKAAISEAWDENYGQAGIPNGANIAFQVGTNGETVLFSYSPTSHILMITVGDAAAVPEPATLALVGLGLAGIGCARRRARSIR